MVPAAGYHADISGSRFAAVATVPEDAGVRTPTDTLQVVAATADRMLNALVGDEYLATSANASYLMPCPDLPLAH